MVDYNPVQKVQSMVSELQHGERKIEVAVAIKSLTKQPRYSTILLQKNDRLFFLTH